MTTVTIEPPKDAGAARIGVFAPDGQMLVVPQLILPPSGKLQFDAPTPGTYTASLESLGGGRTLWSFAVEGTEALTVQAPSMAPARRASIGTADKNSSLRSRIIDVEVDADQLKTLSLGFQAPVTDFTVGTLTFPAPALPTRGLTKLAAGRGRPNPGPGPAYSLGLSYDSRPLSYGGWRPYTAEAVQMHHTEAGDVEIEFYRDDQLPAPNAGARLRLSFAIEATRVQRMLVPLFAGGVTVRVRTATAPYLTGDKLSIVPSRPETHALLQAVTSNSTDVATRIWTAISSGPAHLARYASADVNDDPWISVAIGLLMLRLGWLTDHGPWIDGLAQQHAWIADASILAAHQRLAQAQPDVNGALKHLQHARHVGAVYFFEANRLQGDLLCALAADAPDDAQRAFAGAELARWRHNLANQVQIGAFFSWLMTNGARTWGGLDRRYSAILDSGRLEGP